VRRAGVDISEVAIEFRGILGAFLVRRDSFVTSVARAIGGGSKFVAEVAV
jgi:hypothetical protein